LKHSLYTGAIIFHIILIFACHKVDKLIGYSNLRNVIQRWCIFVC